MKLIAALIFCACAIAVQCAWVQEMESKFIFLHIISYCEIFLFDIL